MNQIKKPELLSPAGSMECIYAAVNNGCDAVYCGGKAYSARQYAGNFTLEELEQACDYCHLRNVKFYVTINTIYKESELKGLIEFVNQLYHIGVDALIVQDLGAAKKIREVFPDFSLHASTQMTTNSLEDVNFLCENGFEKIVLSRELSLEEISYIKSNTQCEIETFVHGALCVSFSGQCIMSSILGGRSGNRGKCAQVCRLPYSLYKQYDKIQEGYLLSPKDIETISILPQLIEAGIDSFKIEGRMKSPQYVAGVTGIYRKYIDLYFESPEKYQVLEEDSKVLLQLFNRGGFSQGYYNAHSGSSMMNIIRPKPWGVKTGFVDSYTAKFHKVTIRTREPLVPGDGIEIWTQNEPHTGSNISKQSKAGEVITVTMDGEIAKNDVVYKTHDKALSDRLKKTWEKDTRKKEVYGEIKIKIGQPMAYSIWDYEGNRVYVTGDVVEEAKSQPISFEKIKQQAAKTGNTPFFVKELSVTGDESVYIPISSINALRREAIEAFLQIIVKKSKKPAVTLSLEEPQKETKIINQKRLTVLVLDKMQFDAAICFQSVNTIYFEINDIFIKHYEACIALCKENNIQLFAAMPRVYRKYSHEIYGSFVQTLAQSDIDGFLVRSLGQFDMLIKTGKKIAVDYTVNPSNQEAVDFWLDKGAKSVCVSVELNKNEINQMAYECCEMVVYGYLPLMTTHQCPVGAYEGQKENSIYCCKKDNKDLYYLKDRKNINFPLMTDCKQCVCTILNAKPLFTLKFFDEILETATGAIRLDFTKEGPRRTEKIIAAYEQMLKNPLSPDVETKILLNEMSEKGSTKGHFFRGVE